MMSHEHIFPTHPLPENQLHQHEDPIKRHDPAARQNARQSAPPIAAKPCDPQAIPAVVNLYNNLMTIQKAGKTVFGHHDSFAYGRSNGGWALGDKQKIDSDVNEALNKLDYPGMTGWDIGGNTVYAIEDINGVKLDDIAFWIERNYFVDHISTICWHAPTPTPKGGKDGGKYNVLSSPNEIKNCMKDRRKFEDNYLSQLKNFFLMPQIKNVPIIFRPYHEANLRGSFWWDNNNERTNEEYKWLWRTTVDYLRKSGVHNLLYVFSLNEQEKEFNDDLVHLYPEDEYVDIIGLDCYQRFVTDDKHKSYYEDKRFISRLQSHYSAMEKKAIESNKLLAITEIGIENFQKSTSEKDQYTNWFSNVLLKATKDLELSYVMLWRNPNPLKSDFSPFYCPYKGHFSVKDFQSFFLNQKFVFHRALRQMKFNQGGALDFSKLLINRKVL